MNFSMAVLKSITLSLFLILFFGIVNGQTGEDGKISVEINDLMQIHINTVSMESQLLSGFQKSEYLISNNDTIFNFILKSSSIRC